MKKILTLITLLGVGMAVTGAEPIRFTLDTSVGVRVASTNEFISYSPNWNDVKSSVRLIVDGEEVLSTTESGVKEFDMSLLGDGVHTFMLDDGVKIYTAEFLVGPQTEVALDSNEAMLVIDTQSTTREARDYELFTYSPNWNDGAYCAIIKQNGGELLLSSTSEGVLVVDTRGFYNGINTFTHNDGVETLEASFNMSNSRFFDYSIVYDANGGTGEMPVVNTKYGTQVVIATNAFTKTAFQFVGWGTEPNGDVVYTPGQTVFNLTDEVNGVVTLYALWETLVVPAPVVTPAGGSHFVSESCVVTLSCAIEGAKIYYSPKGSTPRLNDSFLYKGPFTITDTATIKAIAVYEGVKSDYVTAIITKRAMTLAEAAGAPDLVFTTGGDAEWKPIVDSSTDSGYSVQSGAIGMEQESWLSTEVTGSGVFSFKWRVDCEWDDSGDASWDRGVVYTNGVEAARIDGTSDWEEVTLVFEEDGTHTIEWVFIKDDYDEYEGIYEDALWLTDIVWTPNQATNDPIPKLNESATTEDVAKALAGSVDQKLVENITSVNEYKSYREWAISLTNATPDDVKASSFAWLSYALNTSSLISTEIRQGDLAITEFVPAQSGNGFSLVFALNNIMVGSGATPENLDKVFAVEGSDTLDTTKFSSDNVVVSYGTPKDGKVNVNVSPKNPSTDCFFMRVKLK